MRPHLFVALLLLLLPACSEGGRGSFTPREGGSGNGQSQKVEGAPEAPPGHPGFEDLEPAGGDPGTEPDTLSGRPDPDAGASEGHPSRFPRPEHVRGIYLNAWTAGSPVRRGRLIELARRTELNAFVIDVKDATGYLSHPSNVPLAKASGANNEIRIRDLPALLSQLEKAGIYPIARIVVAKDPLLAEARPDLAIQDSAGGPWSDQKGVKWLNFHHPEVWDYHLHLAQEVAKAGFPEIQWDYVRFPDAPEDFLSRTVYPGSGGRTRAEAVRAFLGYTRDALGADGVSVTADVFGVTTSYPTDVGIGQLWESFIDQVDVALPMVYPSHYSTRSYGYETPNAHPYEIVRAALRDAVRRSAKVEGSGIIRPWLQDFSLGEPIYGSPEVRAQIQATYDVGLQEWILWNPGSRYTEAALVPARGLPSWLEPVMRVGGEVVAVSRRFEVLGEDRPEGDAGAGDFPALEGVELAPVQPRPGAGTLPAVPIPDTGRVARPVRIPDTTAVPASSPKRGGGPGINRLP